MQIADPAPDSLGAERFIREKLKQELSPELFYHGWHHTEDVLNAAMQIASAEHLSEDDRQFLRLAVLLHDSGFCVTYKNHEEKSCELAKEILPVFGYGDDDVNRICRMIMATHIPQQPHTKPEQVICDADLDYLGRDDFDRIGKTLFRELIAFGIISDEKQWNEMQIRFLENHTYHTGFSQQNREPGKQEHLAALKEKYQ